MLLIFLLLSTGFNKLSGYYTKPVSAGSLVAAVSSHTFRRVGVREKSLASLETVYQGTVYCVLCTVYCVLCTKVWTLWLAVVLCVGLAGGSAIVFTTVRRTDPV